jgi:putative hemolysin
MSEEEEFLDLGRIYPGLKGGGLRGVMRRGVGAALGLPALRRIVAESRERVAAGEKPFEALMAAAGITVDGGGVEAAIPREGGVVVVANHPFGGADALALGALCTRVRPDTRMLANAELLGIGPIAKHLISLHVLGGEGADRRNVAALREGLDYLRGGGLLAVFPAGAVSFRQADSGRVEDPPWPEHTARLVMKAGVPVLPVRFFGWNPAWYQVLGARSPLVRTTLIPRAFLTMRGKAVRCAAGKLLERTGLPNDAEGMTAVLRRAVYGVSALGGN